MKKILGSFLYVVMLFNSVLDASEYTWNTFIEKDKAHVGESVYVKYSCEFDDDGKLYIIDFEPRSNEFYELALVSKNEKLTQGKRVNTYEYLIQVKSMKDFEVVVEATMKQTSLDSIVENTTNHYDDTKFDSIHSKKLVKMKTHFIEVLQTPRELIGNFELDIKVDKPSVKAYEPYHLEVKVLGKGNFDAIKALTFEVENTKVFSQKAMKRVSLSKDGYKGEWSQKFAFTSENDFVIPSKTIEYFDIQDKKVKTLSIPALKVEVKQAYKKAELLDEVEETYIFSVEYLYYALTLLAGFLLGKIVLRIKHKDMK